MLFGDFSSVMALSDNKKHKDNGPMNSDYNLSFLLNMVNGLQIMMQSLDYANYREGSLDIWGEKGRIEIVHEGLNYIQTDIGECRTLSGAKELSFDKNNMYFTGYGESLFNLYENLANAINYGEDLDSTGKSALISQSIVDSIIRSYKMGGEKIIC
jgi:Predicted dehydrogenases and related proteins